MWEVGVEENDGWTGCRQPVFQFGAVRGGPDHIHPIVGLEDETETLGDDAGIKDQERGYRVVMGEEL
jgi:hypothetical protein